MFRIRLTKLILVRMRLRMDGIYRKKKSFN